MSGVEIACRVWELAKRGWDRLRPWGWSQARDFPGAMGGLPGLPSAPTRADQYWRARLVGEARAVREGRLTFFGHPWPTPQTQPWWAGDIWLTDPISGERWPGAERFAFDVGYREAPTRGDVKLVWELNRLQFLPPLALHAAVSGDTADSARVFAMLRGWMAANPPYRGVNWISGVEAASRVVSLLAVLAFIAPPSAEDALAVRRCLDAHARWIARYPSRFSSANNHRVAELVALFLIGLCAPGLSGRRRLRRIQAALEREMQRQFPADGVGFEQAVHYAAYSLEWFAVAGLSADAAGRPFSQAFRQRAGLAVEHLRWLMDEDGQAPQIGDGDAGRVLALMQGPEPRYVASVTAMGARWLGLPQPTVAPSEPALRDLWGSPTPTAVKPCGRRTFPEGGLTIWRCPRPNGDLLLVFDHGPLGALSIAAHGHADALAVWLHCGDEAILIDPGTYFYHTAGPGRDALRGTLAHNTLALEERDQSRIIGPFGWARHTRCRLLNLGDAGVEAEHDGYRPRFGLRHRRRVEVHDGLILIEDRLVGEAKRKHLDWSIGFTLGPQIGVEIDGALAALHTPKGRLLQLKACGSNTPPLCWTLTPTATAPSFGQHQLAPRLRLAGTVGAGPLICRTQISLLANHQ
jgi:hypothetical protein